MSVDPAGTSAASAFRTSHKSLTSAHACSLLFLRVAQALVTALAEEEDHVAQCERWAALGECLRNYQFMLGTCRAQCTHNLVDISSQCINWSESGECEANPLFMAGSCNASCISRMSNLQTKERERMLETARAEREARKAEAAAAEPNRPHRGRSAEEDINDARAGLDGAPDGDHAEGHEGGGDGPSSSAEVEAAEAAAQRAEEEFAEAEDAQRAVAEALAGKPVHEAAAATRTHGDAPGGSPAATSYAAAAAGGSGEGRAQADALADDMRARAAQHLRELRDSGRGRADGEPAGGVASGGAAATANGDAGDDSGRVTQEKLDQERALRDAERVARRERLRAEALKRQGPRRWVLFRTLPVTFTIFLVLVSARHERLSGKASTKAAFAPPGFAVAAWVPAPVRVLLDYLHKAQLAYVRAGGPGIDSVARALVGMYYVNEAVAYLEELESLHLSEAVQGFSDVLDALQLALPAIVASLILGYHTTLCSVLVGLDVVKDVIAVGARIIMVWIHAHFFYVNELMIKKLSMLGCTLLMLASVPENRSKSRSKAMSGVLMSDALNSANSISAAKSALLLAARVKRALRAAGVLCG